MIWVISAVVAWALICAVRWAIARCEYAFVGDESDTKPPTLLFLLSLPFRAVFLAALVAVIFCIGGRQAVVEMDVDVPPME